MFKDKSLFKELIEILKEANQVIPDWVNQRAHEADGGFRGGYSGGRGRGRGRGSSGPRFGASDFRNEGKSDGGNRGARSTSNW